MAREVVFQLLGKPQPKGSKRALPAGGQPGARPIVVDTNPKAKPWQSAIHVKSREAMHGATLMHGPVACSINVYLKRPKSHFGTGRNADKLKDSAPQRPITVPDYSKVIRTVEDGMQGSVYVNDSQIVTHVGGKYYGNPERIEVVVSEIP